jgi:hypothetical protein
MIDDAMPVMFVRTLRTFLLYHQPSWVVSQVLILKGLYLICPSPNNRKDRYREKTNGNHSNDSWRVLTP